MVRDLGVILDLVHYRNYTNELRDTSTLVVYTSSVRAGAFLESKFPYELFFSTEIAKKPILIHHPHLSRIPSFSKTKKSHPINSSSTPSL